eukprot:GEMP01021710.1.p1 GENE.GEMP01021710.1~~GEMP01021710.1.p1  ORF type:complete len:678 (+),score=246.69 GEMP01021710.1:168-2201(+)
MSEQPTMSLKPFSLGRPPAPPLPPVENTCLSAPSTGGPVRPPMPTAMPFAAVQHGFPPPPPPDMPAPPPAPNTGMPSIPPPPSMAPPITPTSHDPTFPPPRGMPLPAGMPSVPPLMPPAGGILPPAGMPSAPPLMPHGAGGRPPPAGIPSAPPVPVSPIPLGAGIAPTVSMPPAPLPSGMPLPSEMTIPAVVRPPAHLSHKKVAPSVSPPGGVPDPRIVSLLGAAPDPRIEQARKLGWVQLPTPDGTSWTWYHPQSGAHVDMATLDANQVLQAAKQHVVQTAEAIATKASPQRNDAYSVDDLAARIAKKKEELLAKQRLKEEETRKSEEEFRKIEEEKQRIEVEKEKERLRIEAEKELQNLKRLPPALRARLMKRGIIKDAEEEKKKAEEAKKAANAADSGSDSDSKSDGPGTPAGDSSDEGSDAPKPPPGPPPEDPLPEGWIKAGVGAETYYWNTDTNLTQYERPTEVAHNGPNPVSSAKSSTTLAHSTIAAVGGGIQGVGKKKYAFEQVVAVAECDISRLIGKKGATINVLKAALGDCQINFSRKGDAPISTAINGTPLFPVRVLHNDARLAKKGKKAIDVYLGYAKTMEYACTEAGLKLAKADEDKAEEAPAAEPAENEKKQNENKKNENKKGTKRKNREAKETDMMDPSAYSNAPAGNWSQGMEQQRKRLEIG